MEYITKHMSCPECGEKLIAKTMDLSLDERPPAAFASTFALSLFKCPEHGVVTKIEGMMVVDEKSEIEALEHIAELKDRCGCPKCGRHDFHTKHPECDGGEMGVECQCTCGCEFSMKFEYTETRDTNGNVISRKSDKCPKCGNNDIEWWAFKETGKEIHAPGTCRKCGANFYEVYTLSRTETYDE